MMHKEKLAEPVHTTGPSELERKLQKERMGCRRRGRWRGGGPLPTDGGDAAVSIHGPDR